MIRHFVIYSTDQFDLCYYFEYSHNIFYHHKMNRHINESQNHYTMNNEKIKHTFFLRKEDNSIKYFFKWMSIEEIEKRHDDKDVREYFFKRTWIKERERYFVNDESVPRWNSDDWST